MKAEDLMIGDWVIITEPDDFHGYVGQVKIINGETDYITVYIPNMHLHDVFANDLQPIPLTSEILEKNGFEKCGNHSWHNEILHQIYVRIVCLPEKDRNLHSSIWRFDFPCVVSAGADDVYFRCDHVHELQHALKLCGIEKEIVL